MTTGPAGYTGPTGVTGGAGCGTGSAGYYSLSLAALPIARSSSSSLFSLVSTFLSLASKFASLPSIWYRDKANAKRPPNPGANWKEIADDFSFEPTLMEKLNEHIDINTAYIVLFFFIGLALGVWL